MDYYPIACQLSDTQWIALLDVDAASERGDVFHQREGTNWELWKNTFDSLVKSGFIKAGPSGGYVITELGAKVALAID